MLDECTKKDFKGLLILGHHGSLTFLMFSHEEPLRFVKVGDLNLHLGSVTCLMTKEHGTSSW